MATDRKDDLPTARALIGDCSGSMVRWWASRGVGISRTSHLEAVVELGRACNEDAERHVTMLIEAGATWTEIARALGVTRQGAWARYGPER